MELFVSRHELTDYIDSYISFDGISYRLHPVEIAARRVEQNAGVEPAQRAGQGRAKGSRRIEAGADPRAGLRIGPEIGLVDALKSLSQIEASQLARMRGELTLGHGLVSSAPSHSAG